MYTQLRLLTLVNLCAAYYINKIALRQNPPRQRTKSEFSLLQQLAGGNWLPMFNAIVYNYEITLTCSSKAKLTCAHITCYGG